MSSMAAVVLFWSWESALVSWSQALFHRFWIEVQLPLAVELTQCAASVALWLCTSSLSVVVCDLALPTLSASGPRMAGSYWINEGSLEGMASSPCQPSRSGAGWTETERNGGHLHALADSRRALTIRNAVALAGRADVSGDLVEHDVEVGPGRVDVTEHVGEGAAG